MKWLVLKDYLNNIRCDFNQKTDSGVLIHKI